jgi:hypothetical protein
MDGKSVNNGFIRAIVFIAALLRRKPAKGGSRTPLKKKHWIREQSLYLLYYLHLQPAHQKNKLYITGFCNISHTIHTPYYPVHSKLDLPR